MLFAEAAVDLCNETAVERALAICDRLRFPNDQFKTRALLVRSLYEASVASKLALTGLHVLQQLQYVLKFLVQALNICEMRGEVRRRGAQRFAHLRRRRATAVSGRMAGTRAGRDPEGSGSPERGEQGQLGSHLPCSRLGHLFFFFLFLICSECRGDSEAAPNVVQVDTAWLVELTLNLAFAHEDAGCDAEATKKEEEVKQMLQLTPSKDRRSSRTW